MRAIFEVWVLAGAIVAAFGAENLPAQVPAQKPGLTPMGVEDIAAFQTIFSTLADPLQKAVMVQNLKGVQVPAFVHVGGGRSAIQDEQLRDSLALPKSRIDAGRKPEGAPGRPAAAAKRRGPSLLKTSSRSPSKGR